MTTTVLNLTEAQAQLAIAAAAAEREWRADAVRQIQRIRRRGAEIIEQLVPLVREVKEGERERLRLFYVVREDRRQAALWAAPLDPMGFPSDEMIKAHAAERIRWERKLEEDLAAYAEAVKHEARRREAIGLDNELIGLQYELRNFCRAAEGRNPGDPANDTGLSYTDTNFLRVPGFTEGNEVFVPASSDGKRVLGAWKRL